MSIRLRPCLLEECVEFHFQFHDAKTHRQLFISPRTLMPSYKNIETDFLIHYKAHIVTINSSINKCTQYNTIPSNHYNLTHVTRQTARPHTTL